MKNNRFSIVEEATQIQNFIIENEALSIASLLTMQLWMQVAKKGPKDRPKEAPRGALMAQTGPTEWKTTAPSGPKWPNSLKKQRFLKGEARDPQINKFSQEKTRGAKGGPKSALKRPKEAPREAQGEPKGAPSSASTRKEAAPT